MKKDKSKMIMNKHFLDWVIWMIQMHLIIIKWMPYLIAFLLIAILLSKSNEYKMIANTSLTIGYCNGLILT